jgi:hypothetical protein
MSKQVKIVVKSFKDAEYTWELDAFVKAEDANQIVYQVYLEEKEPTVRPLQTCSYVPRSPPPVESPEPFRAVVYDSQMWNDQPPVIASEEEEEEEEERVFTPPKRTRGRPKGSKNKRKADTCYVQSRKQPKKVVSAAIMLENQRNGLECACCREQGELLCKCSNEKCAQYLCLSCIEKVERRFESLCPYCRLKF